MEAKAINRYIGSSPRKMRLVADLIRGMSVDKALDVLHFTTKVAAKDVAKTLRSALANAMNRNENERVEPDHLYVKEIFVNQGPTLKRISPAPMGRAYRIRKRSCHLTIIVASKSN